MRFILALYVILSHLGTWAALGPAGTTGLLAAFHRYNGLLFQGHGETNPAVVFFIVLSGYCIHRSAARGRDFDLRAYAIKRAFRIFPVYLLATLVGVVLWVVAAVITPAATEIASSTASITPQGILVKLTGIVALVPSASLKASSYQGNSPLWTVGAEIWLYVVYGLVMALLALGKLRDQAVWLMIALATSAGLLYASADPTVDGWWFVGSLLSLLPLWWIGASVVRDRSPHAPRLTGLAAALVWTGCTLYLRHSGGLLIEQARLVALGWLAALLIRVVDDAPIKWPAVAARLGRSGYSLYAFHGPVLVLLIVIGVPWFLIVPVAIVVGLVVYECWERPLMRQGRSLAEARVEPTAHVLVGRVP